MRDARKYGSAFQPRFRASVSSDSTRRTSSASFCGRGDETTWLNAFRKWPASVSGNFIGSSGVGGQPRMGTPLQEKRSPRLLCLETYLAGAAFHFNEESVPCPGGTLLDFAVCQGVGREGGWGADFQPHTLQRPVPSEAENYADVSASPLWLLSAPVEPRAQPGIAGHSPQSADRGGVGRSIALGPYSLLVRGRSSRWAQADQR
jgi:hypothetical protein